MYLLFSKIIIIFFYSCDIDINECASNPCHHNGICIDRLGEFECNCTDDYEGETCEQLKLVTCDNLPCKNGGSCFNTPGIL